MRRSDGLLLCLMAKPQSMHTLRRAVLVGDPQQLPATVRSQKGKELDLERSLFERLQRAGCPVRMLSVQYRMHPAIRQFPSDYFYGGRLEDGCGGPLLRWHMGMPSPEVAAARHAVVIMSDSVPASSGYWILLCAVCLHAYQLYGTACGPERLRACTRGRHPGQRTLQQSVQAPARRACRQALRHARACARRRSVLEAPPPAFYAHGLLKPYVFFDVAHGQEQRGGASGGSLRNEARLFTGGSLPPMHACL